MNELHRQAYLDAMGVDSYFPRAVLPGALPSPVCLIEINSEITAELAQDITVNQDGSFSKSESMAKDVLASMGLGDISQAGAQPAIKPNPQTIEQPLLTDQQGVVDQNSDSAAVPHFALSLINGSQYTLLSLAVFEPQQQAYQHMMVDILTALGDQAQAQFQGFNWPMINSSAVDQSLPVAKEALDAFVKDNAGQRTVIIFGDVANYLSVAKSKKASIEQCHKNGFKFLIAACTAKAFAEPMLKRDVWDDLLAIRQIKS
jgi:hypothetical protein